MSGAPFCRAVATMPVSNRSACGTNFFFLPWIQSTFGVYTNAMPITFQKGTLEERS